MIPIGVKVSANRAVKNRLILIEFLYQKLALVLAIIKAQPEPRIRNTICFTKK